MYSKLVCVLTLLVAPLLVQCMVDIGDIPKELQDCVETLNNKPSGKNIHLHCLQQFLWKTERVRWSDFNITKKEMDFINSLTTSMVHPRRTKQQTGLPVSLPETGFRIRREYRRLPDRERIIFHTVINEMKRNGQYDTFANLHRGIVVTSAHGGPNFFGWHRVYLALVEEALRRINSQAVLPYWDSTLDFDMDNPVNSIIWSSDFLGNGDGFVTSGPFANWLTPVGRLTRNIGAGSRLLSKEVIQRILSRCRTRDISEPTAQEEFNLELAHGGPHVWVGGQLSGLNTAAYDPTFFLHHAFVDYIWERFRIQQARRCRVNPSTDYPPSMNEHAADRVMDGLPMYTNIDGYQSYWTRFWYMYERSPSCSRIRPFCGTPYLRCDVIRQICVSVARTVPPEMMGGQSGALMEGAAFAPLSDASVASSNRARMQAATIDIGPQFRAPPADSRTQDAAMAFQRRFLRAANDPIALADANTSHTDNTATEHYTSFGPTFAAPASDGRTSDVIGRNIAGGVLGNDPVMPLRASSSETMFPFSPPMPLLPSTGFPQPPKLRALIPNTFNIYDNISPKFRASPEDSRTQFAALAFQRRFKRAPKDPIASADTNTLHTDNVVTENSSSFGPTFAAPASDGRTSDVIGRNIARGVVGNDPVMPLRSNSSETPFPFAPPMPLLPSEEFQPPPMLRALISNTFYINGRTDVGQWVFLPVQVVYTRSIMDTFPTFPFRNGQALINPYRFPPWFNIMSGMAFAPATCSSDRSGALRIYINSQGLNYMGSYMDYALIDSRFPSSSAMAYIGVKSPENGMTNVLLTAYDECGNVCQPTCLILDSNPSAYRPCTGVLNITPATPTMYGRTVADAVSTVWQGEGHNTRQNGAGNVRVVFRCSSKGVLPWSQEVLNGTAQV